MKTSVKWHAVGNDYGNGHVEPGAEPAGAPFPPAVMFSSRTQFDSQTLAQEFAENTDNFFSSDEWESHLA